MRKHLRVLPILMTTTFGAYAIPLVVGVAIAGTAAPVQAATPKANSCGCYRDTAGACFCGKKGKCSCPGECEPAGCEEKRAKELEKEMEAETKRAREQEKKERAREEELNKKAAKVNNDEELAAEARAAEAAEKEAGSQDNGESTAKSSKSNKSKKNKADKKSDKPTDKPSSDEPAKE